MEYNDVRNYRIRTSRRVQHTGKCTHLWSLILVAVCTVLVWGIMDTKGFTMPNLINESVDLPANLLQQGTLVSPSVHGIARIGNNRIGVVSAKLNGDGKPVVHLSISSATDSTLGVTGTVALGNSLRAPSIGTVYVAALSSFQHTQQVTILFIPE